MNGGEIFPRKTAQALAWGGGAALAVTLFFLVFADPTSRDELSHRPDSFSLSAIGYHALAQFLQKDVPVLISRHYSAAKATPERPLLLLEPPATKTGLERLGEMVKSALERGSPVVVVLPKWRGEPMERRPRWVERLVLLPGGMPGRVLETALSAAGAFAEEVSAGVRSEVAIQRFRDGDRTWWSHFRGSDLPVEPTLSDPQLIREEGYRLEPLVVARDGLLVARFAGTGLYLVADPDLLNTRGLARGDNAVLVHGFLIDHLAPKALIVDETLHGYSQATSVWRALLEPPLLVFSLHLLGLLALGLMAGSGRFGRPLEAPPRVPPGKWTLVDNTARLFGAGGHLKHSLEQYLRLTVARAAGRLRLSGAGRAGFRQQLAALARLGRRRGLASDIEELGRAVARLPRERGDPRRVLELSRELYQWRKEMTDGE